MPTDWIIGTLTDFEGTTARIDDVPHPAFDSVMKICRSLLSRKSKVEYKLTDRGEVCDIRPHKENGGQPAPAAQPQAKPSEKSTSPEKPATGSLQPDIRSGLKQIDGEIVAIDTVKRTMVLRSLDEKGYEVTTALSWKEAKVLDQTAQKQKPGWYVTVSYEIQGERNLMTDVKYAERPANMKRSQGGKGSSGGRPFTPRNEKPIIYQCCFKEAVETARKMFVRTDGAPYDETAFNHVMDIALTRAKKDAAELIRESGA